MAKDSRDKLKELDAALAKLLVGQLTQIEDYTDDELLQGIIEKFNTISANLAESRKFAIDISEGILDGETPGRKNMFAATLKQLRSRLSALNFGIRQLAAGKVVNRIEAEGALFQGYNELIVKVADAALKSGTVAGSSSQNMNSWRYHHILHAVNMLHIMVIEMDTDGRIVYANPPAKRLLQGIDRLTPDSVKADTHELIAHIASVSHGITGFPIVKDVHDDDNIVWYRVTTDLVIMPSEQQYYLHVVDDITDWRRNEKKLEKTANVDSLTGTLSRRAGLDTLNHINQNVPGQHCLAFIDLDNLKEVNDSYGHNEGDDYIRIVAEIMLTSSRASECVVRYGGDEFLILFTHCSTELAERVMERMANNLEKLNRSNLKDYRMGFSYGIEEFSAGDCSVDEVIHRADEKMYEHKTNKKDTSP